MNALTTKFVRRLRDGDEGAWFELWEIFGPVLQAQLAKWGRGRVGAETVRDLSQETLAALSKSIDRYDPARGARFSTWLLSIARHTLGDEIDRRTALKRGGGSRPTSLDESFMGESAVVNADQQYERLIFRAKVQAAVRKVEHEADFVAFQVYRMRVFDGMAGKEVAGQLGVSEPTVSRHLSKVRMMLRRRIAETIATFSFTEDEAREAEEAGLYGDDQLFDEALGEIYHKQTSMRTDDLPTGASFSSPAS
ncbi:MAG: RNA polymerase sigma factor [Phycisphaerales bacterium]